MKIGIYKITNNLNQHSYIGQSQDIYRRWNAHKATCYNTNSNCYNYPLYRAFRKYGIENFTFEILEECLIKELNAKEIYWIEFYHPEYNQTIGGYNSPNFCKLTKEQVQEIKQILEQDIEGIVTNQEIAEKYGVYSETISDINLGHSWRDDNRKYPIRISKYDHINKQSIIYYCQDCGKKVSKGAIRCKTCNNKLRKNIGIQSTPITKEELKNLIRTDSFVNIGKQFNVSDNTIRKWCVKYNLPKTKKEIKSYSDEEWKEI